MNEKLKIPIRSGMTATEAKTFGSYSERNAMLVTSALDCDCNPYDDVLTYARWQALGRQVAKGEKGIKLSTYKTYEAEDENGTLVTRKRPWKSTVFCKHQTTERKGK